MTQIILASSSKYRRKLLDQLQLQYQCISPDIDESLLPNEQAKQASERLAISKAKKVSENISSALIIGSDQTAEVNGTILGKPHTAEKAVEQLLLCSGNTVRFWTGLALLNAQTQQLQSTTVPFEVVFRQLDQKELERYVEREQPLDCAGSFKCEGLGIALFEKLSGTDPNSLIGLPLIELVSFLKNESVHVI